MKCRLIRKGSRQTLQQRKIDGVARPKKPKKDKRRSKPKLDGLPDNVRQAIEAKQGKGSSGEARSRSSVRNTGYSGGAPKRTGGRDR